MVSAAENAAESAEDAEAWAVGKRGGVDVPADDETKNNNAKYWASVAESAAGGGVLSFNGRGGAVEPMSGDYTAAMVGADASGTAAGIESTLQSQIDALSAKADVVDVVSTYAELTAYEGVIFVNDIIKVLTDSTHNDAIAYYRCTGNATPGAYTWSYLGSQGPYYTKNEANNAFVPQTRTINGQALSGNISLGAGDVGAIPSGQKGAANGVASLGADGKVPSAQLPSMDYIPTSSKGVANGVASLDANGKVPSAQIPDVAVGSSSGYAVVTTTSGKLTTRSITNNTSTSSSLSANTNLITQNTLRYHSNRTTSANAADTNYTTYMFRGESLNSAETTPTYNGQIAWTYE